jgi:hypothetical protein
MEAEVCKRTNTLEKRPSIAVKETYYWYILRREM